MAGVSLTITAADTGPLQEHLRRLAMADAGRWIGARNAIGAYLLGEIQDNFDRQMLADGTHMPQSQAAIARAGKTLIDSHNLYDSYVYQLTRDGVELGSNKVYAAIHHFGGQTGRGGKTKIVARPVMGIGPRQERRLGDILIDEIKALQ